MSTVPVDRAVTTVDPRSSERMFSRGRRDSNRFPFVRWPDEKYPLSNLSQSLDLAITTE